MSAEPRADLRERQRIRVDALHHRKEVPPAGLRRVGGRDARVLEDATKEEGALRGGIAAVADGMVGAGLAERAVDGAPRIAGELRCDSSEVAPAHRFPPNEETVTRAAPGGRRPHARRGRECASHASAAWPRPSSSRWPLRRSASHLRERPREGPPPRRRRSRIISLREREAALGPPAPASSLTKARLI